MKATSTVVDEKRCIDFNTLSEKGLIWKINTDILHPLGLALSRNEDGTSNGCLVAPDGVWTYYEDSNKRNLFKLANFWATLNKKGIDMKDQHTMIKGYRDLSQEEIDLMNRAKELAVKVGELCSELEMSAHDLGLDGKWLSTGTLNLQTGFMQVIRSIARPTTF